MVNLKDEEYAELKKSANDNKAVLSIVRWFVFLILFAVFMFGYGCHALDIRRQYEQAQANYDIRQIESVGMTNEEYICWVDARS